MKEKKLIRSCLSSFLTGMSLLLFIVACFIGWDDSKGVLVMVAVATVLVLASIIESIIVGRSAYAIIARLTVFFLCLGGMFTMIWRCEVLRALCFVVAAICGMVTVWRFVRYMNLYATPEADAELD